MHFLLNPPRYNKPKNLLYRAGKNNFKMPSKLSEDGALDSFCCDVTT